MKATAQIDQLDTAEGLQKLILGFQAKTRGRIKEWGSAKELVFEIQKLIIDSERLKHQLQSLLEKTSDPDVSIESVQTDFIKILQKIESIAQQFYSRSLVTENCL